MALTMDQLNAVYNDMSVYGDTYKNSVAPMAVNTNVASIPNVEPINNIKPYLPIINQDGNDGGIKSLGAIDYGYDSVFDNTNITPIMPNGEEQPQTNFEYDIGEGSIPQEDIDDNKMGFLEGLLSLPGQAIGAYMKYGPIGQVKRGIEFVKEKQRIAAENQRLADEINARDAARREKEYAAQGKSDPTDQSRAGSSGRRPGSGGNVERKDSGPDRNTDSEGTTYDSGGRQGFGYGLKDGGRIRYGKGGIVTL